MFRCPGCEDVHGVVIETENGWSWNTDLTSPTFAPSVLVRAVQWGGEPEPAKAATRRARHPNVATGGQTVCHSFVTDGRIQFLGDCTHALAGQTVDLPEWSA